MEVGTTVRVPCTLSRGGFAHERVFWIASPHGGRYRGVAFVKYCLQQDGSRLPDGEPPLGSTVDGYVEARVTARIGGLLTIQVPDGELCDIDPAILKDFGHVLVGS